MANELVDGDDSAPSFNSCEACNVDGKVIHIEPGSITGGVGMEFPSEPIDQQIEAIEAILGEARDPND